MTLLNPLTRFSVPLHLRPQAQGTAPLAAMDHAMERTAKSERKIEPKWCRPWYHQAVRIVFDTSLLITALRSNKGAAAEVLRLVLSGDLTILMDYKIAAEYRDVALRPEHLAASRQTSGKIVILIEALEELAEPIHVSVKPRPLSSDPNDDMILDVAINGRADALVTQNTKHFKEPGNQYGIHVLSPIELLMTLRKGQI